MKRLSPNFSGPISRRSFAISSAAMAALWSTRQLRAAGPETPLSDYPFTLGVASGDPTPDSVVLWTRLAPDPLAGGGMPPRPVNVVWQIAEDDGMSVIVRQGTAIAHPDWAHSVHVEVEGLRPDRWYWYQFQVGAAVSAVGRTRTMPPDGAMPERLRFAFVSCQHYEAGLYTAFEHLQREDIDLVFHLGDYIYEDGGKDNRVRRHQDSEIQTIEDYRNRYSLYKLDPALQAAHAIAPWVVTWDDHEVDNNYANDVSEHPEVSSAQLLLRRAAAYKAYYEHMPLRRRSLPQGPNLTLYRRLSFGQLASFHVLDTRQYRTNQPCGDGLKPISDEVLDPQATLLGAVQREWLFDGLNRTRGVWNILAQQVMIARALRPLRESTGISMDQWSGYEHERRRVIQYLRDHKIENPVILTGDIHNNWANEVSANFNDPTAPPVATEFIGTSISSGGDGSVATQMEAKLRSLNPFVKFYNNERGYVHCELTQKNWQTSYRTVEYVTRPGSPLHTRRRLVIESGNPRLQEA
jgi:alkaline phosphatase D